MIRRRTRYGEPLVVPIGHYVGADHPSADMPRRHEIRTGDEIATLSHEQFTVWRLAHGVPKREPDDPWTRRALLETAEPERAGAELILDGLLETGNVVEVVRRSHEAVRFAADFHIHPTVLGLGNKPTDPLTFSLGFVDAPLVGVSRDIYELWRWAPVSASLWGACEWFADIERRALMTNADVTDPELVLDGFLTQLHCLLTTGALYLDIVE